jgi:hypothetical protein
MEYMFRSVQHLFKTHFRTDKYFARPLSLEVLEAIEQELLTLCVHFHTCVFNSKQ